jgi:hypothetical protein
VKSRTRLVLRVSSWVRRQIVPCMCRPVPGALTSSGSASPTKQGSIVMPSPCRTAAICVSPSAVLNGTPAARKTRVSSTLRCGRHRHRRLPGRRRLDPSLLRHHRTGRSDLQLRAGRSRPLQERSGRPYASAGRGAVRQSRGSRTIIRAEPSGSLRRKRSSQ